MKLFGTMILKASYRLGLKSLNVNEASTSGYDIMERFWKKFWKMDVPLKIKVFDWELYHDILPTRVNLINRGMDIYQNCPLCRSRPETVAHIFWECKLTRSMWQDSFPVTNDVFPNDRFGRRSSDYCERIWSNCTGGNLEEDRCRRNLITCWQTWNYRNSIVHSNSQPNAEILQKQILRSIRMLGGVEETNLMESLPRPDRRSESSAEDGAAFALAVNSIWNVENQL